MRPSVTLDDIRSSSLMKIYCKCGRIVDADKGIVVLKKKLHKKLECPICRNARISQDIEEMNGIFDGVTEELYC